MKKQTEKFNKKTGTDFDKISKTVFAPIYPVIVDQLVERCEISRGVCIDIGSGTGQLGMALAKAYDFKVYGLDFSEEINTIALENIKSEGLGGRMLPTYGSVDKIPFDDNFADIIISRGSLFFWNDIDKAFKEIYRVLKPGGKTYIGGGFGNAGLREQITAEMRKKDPDWECQGSRPEGKNKVEESRKALDKMDVDYKVVDDETGLWFMIRK